MSAPLDEQSAWSLVRASPRKVAGKPAVLRIPHDPRPDVWVQVQSSGEWDTPGDVTKAARDLLDLYLPLQLRDTLTIAQIGQSLDGRIATESGRSHYITGPADITRLHRLRALVDAVVVGAGTVAADNPRLTVREVDGENPVRVVLDPKGRLAPTQHVFTDGLAHTVHVRRWNRGSAEGHAPNPPSEVLTLPVDAADMFDPADVLRALRARGLGRVLIEGGGVTVSRFLNAGSLDRLHVTVAPIVIGSGRPALTREPIESLDQALRPPCRVFRLGADVLFDFDLQSVPD